MNIGIIGTGSLSIDLARLWIRHGHIVFFGSRNPDYALEVAESLGVMASGGGIRAAAKFGRVVLLAVHWNAVPDVLKQAGSLRGKTLIDATNPTLPDWSALYQREALSGSEVIAQLVSGAKVVKAFSRMPVPAGRGEQRIVAYSGDDAAAKADAAALIGDAGAQPFDAGSLAHARTLELDSVPQVQPMYVIGRSGALRVTRG